MPACGIVPRMEDHAGKESPLSASDAHPPERRASVLLVMRPGTARQTAAEALRGAGFRVRGAREPYEGTARFVERPSDLVVVSLAGFRRRDTAFLRMVKKRAPETRILLLVPEGRRHTALEALQAGADAYTLEPFYPAELTTIATALLAARRESPGDDGARTLGRLAGEVAHAINNPLQILALLGESAELSDETRTAMGAEVGRVQEVMRILSRFGLLRRPQLSREPLGRALLQSLDSATAEGRIQVQGTPPEEGPAVEVDSSQTGVAFDVVLQFLAARGDDRPLPVAARVRPVPEEAPRAVEAVVRGTGIHVEPDQMETIRESVLLNRDDTRQVYPGLALAEAVARNHGGTFVSRPTAKGLVLGLRLPMASPAPGSARSERQS